MRAGVDRRETLPRRSPRSAFATPLAPVGVVLGLLCAGVLFALEAPNALPAAARAAQGAPGAPSAPLPLECSEPAQRTPQRQELAPRNERSRSGAVVDASGAFVGSLSLVRQLGEARFELGASAVDGRFEWPLESLGGELWVEHQGWVCVRGARVDAGPHARTLVVASATVLRGRVRSAGVEVRGARVSVGLERTTGAAPSWSGASAVTGADGVFEIGAIPRGIPLSVRVSHPEFLARSVAFEAAPERWVELELEPLRAEFGRLRGVVLTHDGARADARSAVVWGRNGTRCAADGSFELALAHDPGAAPIVVRAPGVADSHTALAWDRASDARTLELRQGAPLESLIGWIRPANDAGELKGCVVELHRQTPDGEPLARTRADANGRYEFRGLERGEYWVRAERGVASASVGPIPSGGRAPELFISR